MVDFEGQSRHAFVVVGAFRNRSRNVRPVSLIVVGNIVLVDEIMAFGEFGFFEVAGNFAFAAVGICDARINYGNDHALAFGDFPRFFGLHDLEIPLLAVARIVGLPARAITVRFGQTFRARFFHLHIRIAVQVFHVRHFHAGIAAQRIQRLLHVRAIGQGDAGNAGFRAQIAVEGDARAHLPAQFGQCIAVGTGLQLQFQRVGQCPLRVRVIARIGRCLKHRSCRVALPPRLHSRHGSPGQHKRGQRAPGKGNRFRRHVILFSLRY